MQHLCDLQWLETCGSGQILGGILTTGSQELYLYVSLNDLGLIQKSITVHRLGANFKDFYSGIFYFCQYLHIGTGILSFGGDVFRF